MLHSGNEEAYGMFQREAEASFFETEREAIEKVKYFLSNNKHRMEILERGLDRAKRNHSMDHRAEEINCILKQFNC
jgi:spore maturation protein CgeB